MFRCRSEQNDPGNGLIQLEMKKRTKPFPPLAKGQLWKTDTGSGLLISRRDGGQVVENG